MGDKEINLENLESIDAGDDESLMMGKQMLQGLLMNGREIEDFDQVKETIKKGYQRGLDYYEGQYKYGKKSWLEADSVKLDMNNPLVSIEGYKEIMSMPV